MNLKIKLLIVLLNIAIGVTAQNYVVTSVVFEGSKKTSSSFLKSIIYTKQGDILNEETIKEDITRLVRLPSIANAEYTLNKNEDSQSCAIIIKLQENHTLIPFANFFQTSDKNVSEIAYSIGLFEHNLFKRSITLGALYQRNVYDSFTINLSAPFLFNKKTGLAFNYNNLTTQEPVFFETGSVKFRYNNTSYELLGLHQFNFKNKISLGINLFTETYHSITDISNIPEAQETFSLDKTLFKTTYTHDNLKYHFQYISGFKSEFNFQYVTSGEGSENDFIIGSNDFFYFKRIKKRGNWANRLRLGLSSNSDSPFAPFAVDNNLNVRGVGDVIDRGTGVIVLNSEFRYTLKEKDWYAIQTNTFVDTGTWRTPGGDFSDFTKSKNVRIFPGVGIRFIHKKIFNLTLRADFGYGLINDDPFGFVFGVGQYF